MTRESFSCLRAMEPPGGLHLSYSSSTAPTKDDDESSTSQVESDDDSSDVPAPDVEDETSESDDEPAEDFDSSLASRLTHLDEASSKATDKEPTITTSETDQEIDDDEETQETKEDDEETTEDAPGEEADVQEDDMQYLKSLESDGSIESVAETAMKAAIADDTSPLKSTASSVSSKDQDASSELPLDRESESVTFGNVGASASSLSPEGEPKVDPSEESPYHPAEDISDEQSAPSRPPLFPRRSRSNPSSLREKMKPGIASFFRSRSNTSNREKSDRSVEAPLKLPALEGRLDDQGDEASNLGGAAGSVCGSISGSAVASCSVDTIEMVAVDGKIGTGNDQNLKEAVNTEEVAAIKSDEGCDKSTTTGVVKGASSDADSDRRFSKKVNRIYGSTSSACNEIQDPWPNPWSDAGKLGTAHVPPCLINPQLVNSADGPAGSATGGTESVLESIVGVLLSSDIAGAPANKEADDDAVVKIVDGEVGDKIFSNPAACNSNPVNVSPFGEESSIDPLIQIEQTVEEPVLPTPQDKGTCTSRETDSCSDENGENPSLMQDWKELLIAEGATSSVQSRNAVEGEEGVESKGNARRQSSLWRRTKSMVKTRRAKKNKWQVSHEAKKEADREDKQVTDEAKKPKGQKFKLGYLCLFSPCSSKKLSPIKEVDEAPESVNKPMPETEGNHILVQGPVPDPAKSEADAMEPNARYEGTVTKRKEGNDDLMEILDHIASCEENHQPSPLQIEEPPSPRPVRDQPPIAKPSIPELPKKSAASSATPYIEEAKSDLAALDIDAPKNSSSWVTGLPSMESVGQDPQKSRTFSDVSTIGDLSHGAAPSVINSINFYVNAASKAVQHSLYDVPLRELEKLRETTCGSAGCAEQISLIDGGMTATESHDSIKCSKPTTGTSGTSTNPFSIVFSELIDVLECSPSSSEKQAPTTEAFEEQKIEMFGSS